MLRHMLEPKRVARVTISLRIDPETLARIRALVGHLAKRYPTFKMSVSDAARLALDEGLATLERRLFRSARGRRPR
jgi:hypothetical protein